MDGVTLGFLTKEQGGTRKLRAEQDDLTSVLNMCKGTNKVREKESLLE